jgi:glycosyltransferase involved in cell wall biosynthesis
MIEAPAVDVILPALNEELGLARILPRVPAGYRAVVVDNGSTDATAVVAEELGAVVVREPRRGFGAACWAGLQAAEAPVVAFCDADGSFDLAELPRVCEPVVDGDCALALGRRQAEAGAWPVHARAANALLAAYLRRRTGLALRDLGPMRAARRDGLHSLGLTDRRSGWPLEMVLRAVRAGWVIREIPVSYRARVGASKVTGTIGGTIGAVRDMTRLLRDAST